MQVIFVDDERWTVEDHIKACREQGHLCDWVSSASEAISTFSRWERAAVIDADLLVMDMMMPAPDGVVTASVELGLATGAYLICELRKWNSRMPVVVLSNLDESELIRSMWPMYLDAIGMGDVRNRLRMNDQSAVLSYRFGVLLRQKRNTRPFYLASQVEAWSRHRFDVGSPEFRTEEWCPMDGEYKHACRGCGSRGIEAIAAGTAFAPCASCHGATSWSLA